MNQPNLYPAPSFSYKDLLLRKLYYSVTCSVFSQFFILVLYVFSVNLDIFHPTLWLSSGLATLTSFSTWLFIFPFITIIFAQSIICSKDYVFKSNYCSTRFQKVLAVFSVHNFVLLFLHVTIGAVLVYLCLTLGQGPYENLIKECKGQNCLVEGAFFLIFGGLWTGFYFFLKVYIAEKRLLFPVVHQRKILQFKTALYPMIKESLTVSLWPSLYFILMDFVWGAKITDSFKETFSLFTDESTQTTTGIYLYLWMFSSLYFFNMNLMRFFFNLFLTEPVDFPLIKFTPDSLTLQDGITMSNLPIVQNLACLDLHKLAQWSHMRRQVFFTLSQPGGHPTNWNCLVETVIKLCTEYMEILNKSVENSEKSTKPSLVTTPGCTNPPLYDKFVNLRNMSLNLEPDTVNIVEVTHKHLPTLVATESFFKKLTQKLQNFLEIIKVLLGINFFFGELPQANVQKCLGNGQLIIWTCQGISDLTCASLTEDRYGIVQKDLPVLITTLVQLKQSLDKLNKVPALTRKIAGYNDFNYKMKGAVSLAVKRSLFNICVTFRKYLKELPLNKDIVQHLNTFIICKN